MKKTAVKNLKSIEEEILSVLRVLNSTADASTVALREKPAKGVGCKGSVSLYLRADLQRQEEEGIKACPLVSYDFYPSVFDPARLGSVTIYGEKAVAQYIIIKKHGRLFGHPVRDARLEMGRRLFVDVRLSA